VNSARKHYTKKNKSFINSSSLAEFTGILNRMLAKFTGTTTRKLSQMSNHRKQLNGTGPFLLGHYGP
jgi:hypothetical protein